LAKLGYFCFPGLFTIVFSSFLPWFYLNKSWWCLPTSSRRNR